MTLADVDLNDAITAAWRLAAEANALHDPDGERRACAELTRLQQLRQRDGSEE